MTRTIFRSTFLVGVLGLLLCAALFFFVQYSRTLDDTYAALQQEAVYAEHGLAFSGRDYLSTLANINRVTWIDAEGDILYDSISDLPLTNQRHCPEVASALAAGEGRSIRRSESTGADTMYYALRCGDGTVLRLSRPLGAVQNALAAISPILLILVAVLLISAVLSFRAAKQIVKPINAVDLDHPDAVAYPELRPLMERLQEQQTTIHSQIAEMNRQQKEFSALTDSMGEGFLLIDRRGIVLSGNSSALHIIGCQIGDALEDRLSGDMKKVVPEALDGKRLVSLFEKEGQSWEMIANPVVSRGQPSGAVILMVDVTEREQREQLRREFSANVSHELKTPLTSISGFAELMAQGIVPKDKIKEFASDIYRESQRMITLVDDIIKLSRLDEEGVQLPWEDVDLRDLAADVMDSLRGVADSRHVSLRLTGGSARVRGVWQVLSEMVYNLCDNAIKYNRPEGQVELNILEEAQTVRFTVRDTGIGIPYAHQKRVFERFYRVDKSHSKEIGGTGLGLSIVKHGAQLHGAQLELKSQPGAGTAVTLIFPKQPPG